MISTEVKKTAKIRDYFTTDKIEEEYLEIDLEEKKSSFYDYYRELEKQKINIQKAIKNVFTEAMEGEDLDVDALVSFEEFELAGVEKTMEATKKVFKKYFDEEMV